MVRRGPNSARATHRCAASQTECGIGRGAGEGCRQALDAARRMAEKLEQVNAVLAHDLEAPLRIGVGIHVGPAIVGEMGYGRATSVTAIGDAVNTASRLETLTKEFAAELVVSEAVETAAGADLSRFARHEIEIRGRSATLPGRVRTRPMNPIPTIATVCRLLIPDLRKTFSAQPRASPGNGACERRPGSFTTAASSATSRSA